MLDEHDDDSVIEKKFSEIFADYVNQKIIQGGMIPNLKMLLKQLRLVVKQVVITQTRDKWQ